MASATRTQSTPTLPGVPQQAAEQIRTLAKTVQRQQAQITQLANAGFLTKETADTLYSPPVMAKELSSSGSNPLNVVVAGGRTFLQPQPTKGNK